MFVDTKLKDVYREVSFWVMLAMSLPGIIAAYLAAYHGLTSGHFEPSQFEASFAAIPIVAYLLARQYPRAKAVEAASRQVVAVESNPPAGATPAEVEAAS